MFESVSRGPANAIPLVPRSRDLLFYGVHLEQEETEITENDPLLRSLCCLLFNEFAALGRGPAALVDGKPKERAEKDWGHSGLYLTD
jgi:hypothetical protein